MGGIVAAQTQNEFADRKMARRGTIALQAHDPKSFVLYRNLRIKPLD